MPTIPTIQRRRSRAWAYTVLLVLPMILAGSAITAQAAGAAGPLIWSAPALIDPGQTLTAISCPLGPPEALCATVDNAGNILVSTNPTGGASAWQKTNIDGTTPLTDVECQGRDCIAVDGLGNVLLSSSATGEASSWTKTSVDPGNGGLTGVSCPLRDASQVGFCLAVDHVGNAVIFSGGWKTEPLDTTGGHLNGVSCTEFSEWCIAFDDLGNIVTSTEAAAGWTITTIDPDNSLTGASCPYIRGTGYYAAWEYCLVADQAGNVITASEPAGGASAWATSHIEAHSLTGVSCPFVLEAYFCAAVDDAGNAATSSNPLGGAANWSVTPIDPGTSLTGISCPYSEADPICFAIDATGNVIVGTGASEEPPHKEEPQHEASTPKTGSGGTGNGSTLINDGGISAVTVSSAQLKAWLARQLIPSGQAVKIGALLKNGGFTMPFKALEAGALVVGWYQVLSGAKLVKAAKAKPVLVASGKLTFSAAETGKLKIKLTAAGKRLLKHAKRLGLTAKGTFAPTGATAVGATSGFRLK
jgi:hypothetical protein